MGILERQGRRGYFPERRFFWGASESTIREVIGSVNTRVSRYLSTTLYLTFRFGLISFFKGDLGGQSDTAKQDLETRVRTEAIKEQVGLEGQGNV